MIEAPSVSWYFCEGIFFCLIAASYVLSFSSLRLTRVAMQPVRISLRTVVERRRVSHARTQSVRKGVGVSHSHFFTYPLRTGLSLLFLGATRSGIRDSLWILIFHGAVSIQYIGITWLELCCLESGTHDAVKRSETEDQHFLCSEKQHFLWDELHCDVFFIIEV